MVLSCRVSLDDLHGHRRAEQRGSFIYHSSSALGDRRGAGGVGGWRGVEEDDKMASSLPVSIDDLHSQRPGQVQCCFTSTETIRTIRDGQPRTSTSSFTQLLNSLKRPALQQRKSPLQLATEGGGTIRWRCPLASILTTCTDNRTCWSGKFNFIPPLLRR